MKPEVKERLEERYGNEFDKENKDRLSLLERNKERAESENDHIKIVYAMHELFMFQREREMYVAMCISSDISHEKYMKKREEEYLISLKNYKRLDNE